jgi:hypothetical protein
LEQENTGDRDLFIMIAIKKRLIGQIYRWRLNKVDLLNRNVEFLGWAKENDTGEIFRNNKERKWDSPERTVDMYEFINQEVLRGQPIDYLEFGVFGGRTLRIWTKLNNLHDSRFFGFDSFEGLPEDWSLAIGRLKAGTFSLDGDMPKFDDHRIQLIKGLFQETLPTFVREYERKGNLILHLDADLYSSTLFCLAVLDPILDGGAVIIFDEFDNLPHEFAAFQDYSGAFRRNYDVVARYDYFKKVAIRIGARY